VVVSAWLLLGAVAGVPLAVASGSAGAPLGADDDGLLNETTATLNDTTTDILNDTTTDTLDGTTTTIEETTDGTTSTLNETVNETTDTLDDTTTVVEETTDGTVEDTGDTVDSTTGGTTNDTTDAATTAIDGTTDAVNTTTTSTTDTAADTATMVDRTTNDTTDAVSAAAEGDLEGTTDSLESATGEVTSYTGNQLTTLTETTESATTDLTGGTTDAVTTLEGGTVESTTDAALTNGSIDDATASGAAARVDGDETTPAGGTGGDAADGSGAADGSDGPGDERSLATAGSPLTTLGVGDLPASEDGATGVGLSALLLGAVGAAVRQASLAGGSGAGTTVARAGATALANGDGPLSRLARMLSLFRYSRYDDSDPLELNARRQVYEAISEQPGEPITAISERADVNLSTARHHVKVLRREELVATARVRNCERFYPAGTDDVELAAAMADECTADIIDALVRLEPASVSGLAEDVDRSPSTVTHHLQKLEDDGIVVRERNGRSVENKLSEAASAALDPETERRPHAAERRLETDARADATSGAQAD
jgi:DNA-binding transcriptional ArsR family regulator